MINQSWITNDIKHKKTEYRKAKLKNITFHLKRFRRLRNQVVLSIKLAKDQYIDSLSNKLKKSVLLSKDWWKILRGLISDKKSVGIPPLCDDD
jgi:hypothetical protein